MANWGIEVIGIVAGVLGIIAWFPQLNKIWIQKSAEGISLFAFGLIFIALLFYTFETLLVFSLIYMISIPISIGIFKKQQNKYSQKISDEDHEDIL